jgi:hypothetical protein
LFHGEEYFVIIQERPDAMLTKILKRETKISPIVNPFIVGRETEIIT